MKRVEYTNTITPTSEERIHELEATKQNDYDLPEFSREVPVSSKKRETGHDVAIEYEWKTNDTPIVRVKRIDYRDSEKLDDLYRVAARDGADSLTFKHNGSTFILRRTAREIARALYNAYGKIKGAIESIVGYLRTALGNDYVISKVEHESWSFDRRVARDDIRYADVDALDRNGKSNLCQMITEKIAELHAENVIMGRFTLNNILFSKDDMTFTDLRKMRISRKRSYVIDEFKSMLQYLFATGIATREDIYCSIAYYTTKNEESAREWYAEKKGVSKDNAPEAFEIACALEEEVYN